MLTVFWDFQGPIYCDFLEGQRTINSQYYSDILENKIRPAIRTKRRGLLTEGVILLHDNARPHTYTADERKTSGTEVGDPFTSPLQPRPRPIRLPSVWTP